MISAAGQQLVEQGQDLEAVLLAETLLAMYRAMRILQLMDESGCHDWEGIKRDELSETLGTMGEAIGVTPGDPESDEAVYRFVEFRVHTLEAMAYKDYLWTPEWKDVRRFAIWKADGRCQTCNARGRLQVHHRTYERRGHEDLADVTVLCDDCHRAFHENRGLTR